MNTSPPKMVDPDPLTPRPITGWVPIRVLYARHRRRLREHLLTLDNASRLLRFGHMATDEQIERYVEHIDFGRDEVFGIFDRRLRLLAAAHLAFDVGAPADVGTGPRNAGAEFGVSVLPRARGRGLGSRLFDHAVISARNRGVRTMVIHLARENQPMLHIVRRAGARVQFDGSDAIAHLPLPAGTLASQIEAAVEHQAAEIDYRLKVQVFRLFQAPAA